MNCINCKKKDWFTWDVKMIAPENEKLVNQMACSEKCFLEWWIDREKEASV